MMRALRFWLASTLHFAVLLTCALPVLAEMAEAPEFVAAIPAEEIIYPISPAFNIMLVIGILILIFAGMVVVDIIREPTELPAYIKPISDAILNR